MEISNHTVYITKDFILIWQEVLLCNIFKFIIKFWMIFLFNFNSLVDTVFLSLFSHNFLKTYFSSLNHICFVRLHLYKLYMNLISMFFPFSHNGPLKCNLLGNKFHKSVILVSLDILK